MRLQKNKILSEDIQSKPSFFVKNEAEKKFFNTSVSDASSNSLSPNLTIQRKCKSCENKEKEERIQKKETSAIEHVEENTNLLSTTEAAYTTTEVVTNFIVDDYAYPEAGQMTKTDFLSWAKAEVDNGINEALASTNYTSDNFREVQQSFEAFQNNSAAEIETSIISYCPSVVMAQNAQDLIWHIKQKAYSEALKWVQSEGEFTAELPIHNDESPAKDNSNPNDDEGRDGLFFKENAGGAGRGKSPYTIMRSLGKGNSINSNTRSKMESAFGTNFSNVEIHTGNKAAKLANDMNARAFTVGNHIAFANGEHQPGTIEGDAIMAHELAHTIQQSNGLAQTQAAGNLYNENGLENDADFSAIEVVSQMWSYGTEKGKKNILPKIKTGLGLQRCGAVRSPIMPHQVIVNQREQFCRLENRGGSIENCCTQPMLNEISNNVSVALGYIENAITRLSNPFEVASQLQNNFRISPENTEDVEHIRVMLMSMQHAMISNNVTYMCRDSFLDGMCFAKNADTIPTCSTGEIHMRFCGRYEDSVAGESNFFINSSSVNWIKTIIHEYAHVGCAYGDMFGANQEFYKMRDTYPRAISENLRNADSYAWFVMECA